MSTEVKLNVSKSRGYEKFELDKSKAYRNVFVDLKFTLKSNYKDIDRLTKEIKETELMFRELESQKEKLLKDKNKTFNLNTLFDLKQELSITFKTLINLESLKSKIMERNEKLEGIMFNMVELGDTYLSTHQKIQLLGGGMKKAQEIIEFHLERKRDTSAETISFMKLVMHHTEYRWNKQRSNDWVDCDVWEMPVFEACMNEMMRRMSEYEQQQGRSFITEFLEEQAKSQGKRLVRNHTDFGVVVSLGDDIASKYESNGNIITLK